MLNNKDIQDELSAWANKPQVNGLNIDNFEPNSLTPVGYDLRVGYQGFSWKRKKIINIQEQKSIQIDPDDTVVIYTFESISLSMNISGTIHSIVRRVVIDGLSHISTTVDPGWNGQLLIAIHNYRDIPVVLNYKDRLCTICFYKMSSEATDNRRTEPNRTDIWDQLIAKSEERKRTDKKNKIIVGLLGYAIAATVTIAVIYLFVVKKDYSNQVMAITATLSFSYIIFDIVKKRFFQE
ncbi:deoxycytidine deaminase [Microcystis aeruginosa CS-555/01A07]|uniref:dCTP deaminase n=1 Tax=Microcystis aeruginosa TaxID=1126 RepID=UPI00232D6553|nr:deoxycytidine deaminase [Microcystis aeruginosa]MDB9430844.1 deoxycytidine deaminase [Microcystis aeruginosa CS-555/01A07]